ncbi:CPS_collapsed_G0016970.mRNA.1.CDS.1 [Saccharomyces cerevisiae]|nr:CPS_collapsed_G0016970.mRNA.1.CDS.1 [Saccharomyces cerevisiae]
MASPNSGSNAGMKKQTNFFQRQRFFGCFTIYDLYKLDVTKLKNPQGKFIQLDSITTVYKHYGNRICCGKCSKGTN